MATKTSKPATLEQLLAKPPRTTTVEISVGEDKAAMRFRALGSKAYDDLAAAHPPTAKQKADGAVWNTDTFPPALIAAASLEPVISVEDAVKIWESPDWSRGELFDLFDQLLRLNQGGLGVPFT